MNPTPPPAGVKPILKPITTTTAISTQKKVPVVKLQDEPTTSMKRKASAPALAGRDRVAGGRWEVFDESEKRKTREEVKRRKGVRFQALGREEVEVMEDGDKMDVDQEEEVLRKRMRRSESRAERLPPSEFTERLLKHANPLPMLPKLPTPPPSRGGSFSSTPGPERTEVPPTPSPSPPPLAAAIEAPKPVPVAPASAPPVLSNPTPPITAPSPRPFTLLHLPPISHHTSTLILHLHPPTHLTLTLRHSTPPTTYTIYPNNGGVTVHGIHYSLPDLPWKHLTVYRYARRFVEFTAARTVTATVRLANSTYGRVWGDGKGVVEFLGGVVVNVSPAGEATISAGELHATNWHLRKAIEIWHWLKVHPGDQKDDQDVRELEHGMEVESGEEEGEWDIDANTKWLPKVGWCKADHERGRWWMRFVDGVRMMVFKDGRVLWWDAGCVQGKGEWRSLDRGAGDLEVQVRVRAWAECGLWL